MDWIQRLKKEKDELYEKIEKLRMFINSEKFYKLNEQNRFLLRTQYFSMFQYYLILEERIDINKKEN